MAFVDWIKVEHTTPNKSEIANIAERLNIDPDAVLGKLVRLWIWADQNSENGNLNVTTCGYIDRITYCPGFGEAMIAAGWLETDSGKLRIPNFDSHNSESAKKRAKNVKKTRKHRAACNQSVTDLLPIDGGFSVTPSSSSSSSTSTSESLEDRGVGKGVAEVDFNDLPAELSCDEFKTLWNQWEQYLKVKHDRVMGLMQRSPAWHELAQRAPPGDVVKFAMSTVRQAMANGWKGLYPQEEKKNGRRADNGTGVTKSAGGGRYEGKKPRIGNLST